MSLYKALKITIFGLACSLLNYLVKLCNSPTGDQFLPFCGIRPSHLRKRLSWHAHLGSSKTCTHANIADNNPKTTEEASVFNHGVFSFVEFKMTKTAFEVIKTKKS